MQLLSFGLPLASDVLPASWMKSGKETIWCLMFPFFQCTVSNSMRAMQKWTKGQMSGRLSLVECSSFLAYLASSSFGRKCIVSKRWMVFPPRIWEVSWDLMWNQEVLPRLLHFKMLCGTAILGTTWQLLFLAAENSILELRLNRCKQVGSVSFQEVDLWRR